MMTPFQEGEVAKGTSVIFIFKLDEKAEMNSEKLSVMTRTQSRDVERIVNQAYLKDKLVSCIDDLTIGYTVDLNQTPNHMCAENMHAEYEFFKFDTHNNEFTYGNIYANKFHNVKLITHAELFNEVSHDKCLCYIMLGKLVELDQMLEKVYDITSVKCLSSAHSCKSTFNLVGDHVANNF
jgi:hypothetical protein